MNFLRNLLAGPIELISGPFRFFEDMWYESDKSRSLLLGLPAILVAVSGLAAFGFANYASGGLEESYLANMEQVSKERKQLDAEIQREGRVNRVAESEEGGGETDPRKIRLKKLRDEEEIYLKKLISMNPVEQEYRYKLAVAKLSTDPAHGISIMQDLAPEDEAGYSKAHAFLANYYAQVRSNSQAQGEANRRLALKHAEHGLKRDKNDRTAKMIKANLLMREDQLVKSYELFNDLFQDDPSFYRALTQINERLDRQDRNQFVLSKALLAYNEMLSRGGQSPEDWVSLWQQMIGCYSQLEDFETATELLERELGRLKGEMAREGGDLEGSATETISDLSSRYKFLQKLLANVYLVSASKKVVAAKESGSKEDKMEGLRMATNAYRLTTSSNGQPHPDVLRVLTRLVLDDDPEVSAAAKEVYDPYQHYSAPPVVLNELGASAMQQEDYDGAVRFFELARKKDPKNPMILNNLAYAWLQRGDRDPERALQLVDEGLRFVSGRANLLRYRSHFLDTRGNALMYLNRYEEAIASFQKALSQRPDDVNLLEQMVICYEKTNLDPSVLVRRIERIKSGSDNEPN